MNTCDSCKWWKLETQPEQPIQNPCANPRVTGRNSPSTTADNLLWIENPAPWETLYTGPKFGCIHHEAKVKTALILVLSSRREPWGDLMDVSMQTWDAEPHPLTQTLYYCAGHNGNQLHRPDVRFSAMEDSLENISPRTLEAFGWALEIEGWDYLARPNSSCYVHKENLTKHIQTLPKIGVVRGAWTGGEHGFLWGGGQYILSRDVVQAIVNSGEGWRSKLMDDEAITRSVLDLGLDVHQGSQFCTIDDKLDGSWSCMCYGGDIEPFTFKDFADLKKATGHFFFRVKQDHNRRLDEKLMRELKKHLP